MSTATDTATATSAVPKAGAAPVPGDLLELAKAADLAHSRIIAVLNGGNE